MERNRRIAAAAEAPGRIIWLDPRADREDPSRRELAVSACRFSMRTRSVLDDKLTLSATLMRAGEIAEARRILHEVERDVRAEEAALLERMNELTMARSMETSAPPSVVARYTRNRVVRLLAVAMVGSAVSMMAVGGFSLAKRNIGPTIIESIDRDTTVAGPVINAPANGTFGSGLVGLTINGQRLMLPSGQARALNQAIAGGLTPGDIGGCSCIGIDVANSLLQDPAGTAGKAVDDGVDSVKDIAAGASDNGSDDPSSGGSGGTGGTGGGDTGSNGDPGSGGGTTDGDTGGGSSGDGGTGGTGGTGGSKGDDPGTTGNELPEIPSTDSDASGAGGI